MSRLDTQAARSLAELEQKFGQSFTKAVRLTEDARRIASSAEKSAEEAKKAAENPSHEKVFEALTEGGRCQGLFRDPETGDVYLNAEYIKTGKMTMKKDMFIEPGVDVVNRISKHLQEIYAISSQELPLYDFDDDGQITENDLLLARQAASGEKSLANWSGAKLSTVDATINFFDEQHTIRFSGTDMWGKSFDWSIGLKSAFLETESNGCMYRMDGAEKEWLNPDREFGKLYRTAERYNGNVVYSASFEIEYGLGEESKTISTGIDFNEYRIFEVNYTFDDGYTIWASHPDIQVLCQRGGPYYNLCVTAPSYGVCHVEIKCI